MKAQRMVIGIIYHANCTDGFAAMHVAREYLAERHSHCVIRSLAYDYSDTIEEATVLAQDSTLLYIVDCSFPRAILDAFAQLASVTLLDHHKTAFLQLTDKPPELHTDKFYMEVAPNLTIVLDDKRSGALLTWCYLNDSTEEFAPAVVQYVSDRDLWRFYLDDSKAINAYIATIPRVGFAWHQLTEKLDSSSGRQEAVKLGNLLLDQKAQICQWHADTALPVHLLVLGEGKYEGYGLPCIGHLASDVGNAICNTHGGFSVTWFYKSNGDIQVSLRGRDTCDVDLSAIAASYGGGGHVLSAGFTVPQSHLKYTEVLNYWYITTVGV